jgi:hypothetical protein
MKRKDMEVIMVYFKELFQHFPSGSEEYYKNISRDSGTTGEESNSEPRDANQDC